MKGYKETREAVKQLVLAKGLKNILGGKIQTVTTGGGLPAPQSAGRRGNEQRESKKICKGSNEGSSKRRAYKKRSSSSARSIK